MVMHDPINQRGLSHPWVMFQIWTSYVTHRQSKLRVLDKQANDNVMHHDRFGEADHFAGEPLDAGAQCQMLPFNLLRIVLAGLWLSGGRCRADVPHW